MPRKPKMDMVELERELQELEKSNPIVAKAAEKLYAETKRIAFSAAEERRIRADERKRVLDEVRHFDVFVAAEVEDALAKRDGHD